MRYQLGDWKPYIYKTMDYGDSWQLLTSGKNGIPDSYPTRVIREDPVKEGVLYAGTEYGMFISLNDGKTWESFQQNLPVTPITDIKVFRGDLVLSTMGIPISILFWHTTKFGYEGFGELWPIRLLGFATGMISFPIILISLNLITFLSFQSLLLYCSMFILFYFYKLRN